MHHASARSSAAQSRDDLQHAARIGAHDDVRRGRDDGADLVALKLARDLGMAEVVDAGAAAAPLRIGDVDDRDAFDRAEQSARLRSNALPMREMAGILVHDPDRS